jgi:pimeloyl-ACP methyl ester carboxylesterase
MKLFFQKFGKSAKKIVVLHGLFGSGDNWRTTIKVFENEFTIFLVDLRNHGRSFHHPDHNYALMAQDLNQLFEEQHIHNAVLVGHSMGGKAAIEFTTANPDKVSKLIVVDIGLRQYTGHHSHIFEGLFSVPINTISERSQAEAILKQYIPDKSTVSFLMKSLYRKSEGGFAWRFALDYLYQQYYNILSPVFPNKQINLPTYFILGEKSQYVIPEEYDEIKKQLVTATFITIPNAGHWVHVDNPDDFIKTLHQITIE